MAGTIPYTRVVRGLPAATPFVGPEALERQMGRPFRVRIGANESAFGISPRAAAAMREAVERISWYADPEGHELRAALGTLHGVGIDEICLAGGIDELLGLTVRMLVEPGTPVVTSLGAYPTFNYHVEGFGGALHRVPYRDDRNDLEALADAARSLDAPLVYLANPDNPMGTWHDADAVRSFIDRLPERTVLVLDEAYLEFAPPTVSWPVDVQDPKVVRMRTFSKAHGMAGARIGYAIASASVVAGYDKIRNHFGVNRVAQTGALASLADRAFIEEVIAEVARGRREYETLAGALGLVTVPSATNFVSIDVGGGDRARAVLHALQERGIFVRMPAVAPLDRCVRVTVGTAREREQFAEAFRRVLTAIPLS